MLDYYDIYYFEISGLFCMGFAYIFRVLRGLGFPRGPHGLHPAALGPQEARALPAARRQLPPHQAREGLLPWEVHGSGSPTSRWGRNAGRPYTRDDFLPVIVVNASLSRQSSGLSRPTPASRRPLWGSWATRPDPGALPGLGLLQADPGGGGQSGPGAGRLAAGYGRLPRDQLPALQRLGDPPSAFEARDDRLCVARQLAKLLQLHLPEVLSDFDAICDKGWEQRGITALEIREFCAWRGAPMFFVSCRGELIDAYQPPVKENKAVAFTCYQAHAYFYKSARAVSHCDDSVRDHSHRGDRKESTLPPFSQWRPWAGRIESGHFWAEDLRRHARLRPRLSARPPRKCTLRCVRQRPAASPRPRSGYGGTDTPSGNNARSSWIRRPSGRPPRGCNPAHPSTSWTATLRSPERWTSAWPGRAWPRRRSKPLRGSRPAGPGNAAWPRRGAAGRSSGSRRSLHRPRPSSDLCGRRNAPAARRQRRFSPPDSRECPSGAPAWEEVAAWQWWSPGPCCRHRPPGSSCASSSARPAGGCRSTGGPASPEPPSPLPRPRRSTPPCPWCGGPATLSSQKRHRGRTRGTCGPRPSSAPRPKLAHWPVPSESSRSRGPCAPWFLSGWMSRIILR